jgi:hypothetical protein
MTLCAVTSFLLTWGQLYFSLCACICKVRYVFNWRQLLGKTMKHGICCQKQGRKVGCLQNWSGPGILHWYVWVLSLLVCLCVWLRHVSSFVWDFKLLRICRKHKSKDCIHCWQLKIRLPMSRKIWRPDVGCSSSQILFSWRCLKQSQSVKCYPSGNIFFITFVVLDLFVFDIPGCLIFLFLCMQCVYSILCWDCAL